MERLRAKNTKTTLKTKKVGGFTLTDTNRYLKLTTVKAGWYCHKDKQVNKQRRPEIFRNRPTNTQAADLKQCTTTVNEGSMIFNKWC